MITETRAVWFAFIHSIHKRALGPAGSEIRRPLRPQFLEPMIATNAQVPCGPRNRCIIMDGPDMSKTKVVKSAILIGILGAAGYFAFHQRPPHPVDIGERAPDFTVPAFPSGSLALNSYRGKVVVLNLWATWCPPCVEETPSLEEFARKMRDQGVIVLGISVDEDPQKLQDFIQQNHLSFPIGRDPERALSARYGTFQFPETYILDRRGLVAEKVIGPTD